jgi:SAM-dependent methyltransferase
MKKCISCNTILVKYNNVGNYCPYCYSVYASTIPSDEELNTYYNNYNINYHGGGRSKGAKNRQLLYAKKYLSIIDRFSDGKELIDIGSSTNPFPNIAQQSGYRVSVVDYAKPEELHTAITFVSSSIENLEIGTKEFDVVTAFAIIEHTKNPLLALLKLTELVRSDGVIVIYIPEMGQFADKYSLGTSNWLCPPEHLNLLSKKALIEIMKHNECDLLFYERFELNLFRFIIRYGIGLLEGTLGYIVKLLWVERFWFEFRQKRKSKYQGLSMFVFKKVKT